MGNVPLISILHPTARIAPSEQFPRGWKDAHDVWLARADHPENIEYVLAVHSSRWEAFSADMDTSRDFIKRGWQRWQAYNNTERDCVVDQLNCAARHSRGKLLVGTMDDYYPPEHWDTLLLEAVGAADLARPELARGILVGQLKSPRLQEYLEKNLDREFQLWFSSGSPRDKELIVAGAMTRKRYERYGFVLDPDFESMFADDWHTFCAKRDAEAGLCKLIVRQDIQFEHRHPSFTSQPMDDVYEQQNRADAYRAGSVILHQKMTGSRVMVMCLPGETFRSELVGSRLALIDSVKAATPYGMVAPHWCHTTNVYATRIELAKAAERFPSVTKDQDLVLMADDDNPLEFAQLQMLISDLDARPELAGVVAWCWCDHNESEDAEARKWVMSCGRQDVKSLDCLRFTSEDFDQAIARGDFLIGSADVAPHAFWSGLPVLLIRRRAMEQLSWKAFIARAADPVLVEALELAATYLDGKREEQLADCVRVKVRSALRWASVLNNLRNGMTSEDTSFFIRAHELGLKFAVDIRVRVPHMKWRGITPQYVPESERPQVMKLREVTAAAAD